MPAAPFRLPAIAAVCHTPFHYWLFLSFDCFACYQFFSFSVCLSRCRCRRRLSRHAVRQRRLQWRDVCRARGGAARSASGAARRRAAEERAAAAAADAQTQCGMQCRLFICRAPRCLLLHYFTRYGSAAAPPRLSLCALFRCAFRVSLLSWMIFHKMFYDKVVSWLMLLFSLFSLIFSLSMAFQVVIDIFIIFFSYCHVFHHVLFHFVSSLFIAHYYIFISRYCHFITIFARGLRSFFTPFLPLIFRAAFHHFLRWFSRH